MLLTWLVSFAMGALAQSHHNDQVAIKEIIDQQVYHWNQGDLPGYMEGYWPSDSLMFIGKSGITYGYDSTLAHYQQSYPDRASMGTLRLEIVSLDSLSPGASLMVGRWFLARDIGDLQGHFTLLFRKIEGRWYIVKDHSS